MPFDREMIEALEKDGEMLRHYLARHQHEMEGKRYAIFNPHNKPLEELPIIYGFNNGGSPGWYGGCLLAEDGTGLGGHICSHESYMLHDLGILEGTRPDRHEDFRKHYPDGYRMDFVPAADALTHPGLEAAYQLNQAKARGAADPPAYIGRVGRRKSNVHQDT